MQLAEDLSKAETRKELDNILAGKILSKSLLLSRFLIEKTRDGHANPVKEYWVGISILDKPHRFVSFTGSIRVSKIPWQGRTGLRSKGLCHQPP